MYQWANAEQTWARRSDGAFVPVSRLPENAEVAPYAPPAPSASDVDRERDRRMGTFSFGGKPYDLQGQSLANVSGAGTLALAAIINGAQPGNLRWADPDADFTWIANDNTMTPMMRRRHGRLPRLPPHGASTAFLRPVC